MQKYFKAIAGWILLFLVAIFFAASSFATRTNETVVSFEISLFSTASCDGESNGAVNLTIEGGTAPFIFNWTGGLPNTEDQSGLAPGDYEVTVTDAIGCISIRPISIGTSSIEFAPDIFASCGLNNGSVQLNVSGGVSPYAVQWSDASINGLNPTEISQGSYQLTVTDANGCSGTTAIDIANFPSFEISVISDANTITIGDQIPFTIQLNGGMLPYEISWFPPVGIQNTTALSSYIGPTESTQYILTIVDANGCLATDQLTILVANPYNASAGPDSTVCMNSIYLTGNLPLDAFGLWEGPEGVIIHQADQATTLVSNLKEGANKFRWTITSFNQLYYDFDDIVIYVEAKPKARADIFFTNNYTPIRNIALLENDKQVNLADLSFELLTMPANGRLIESNELGVYHYLPKIDFIGIDSFRYELCNLNCDQCSDALVKIKISEVTDICEILPTGITPNDDGLNDYLIIDGIEDFPDQHLVVFNRWGDIVYEAKPYQNDWKGTSQKTGRALAAGTYFYHLRLDLGNGIICSKDLTILR